MLILKTYHQDKWTSSFSQHHSRIQV